MVALVRGRTRRDGVGIGNMPGNVCGCARGPGRWVANRPIAMVRQTKLRGVPHPRICDDVGDTDLLGVGSVTGVGSSLVSADVYTIGCLRMARGPVVFGADEQEIAARFAI